MDQMHSVQSLHVIKMDHVFSLNVKRILILLSNYALSQILSPKVLSVL